MHWTAATGTWYQIQSYHDGEEADQNVNLIVAYCLVSHMLQISILLLTWIS